MDIRYCAGLFDGEGCVAIRKWAKPNSTHIRYSVYCSLGMTYKPIIEELQGRFGGSLHLNRHDLRNPKHRIQFTWVAASQIGATAMRQMLPYLVVKRDEAELAIALQDHIDSTPYVRAGRKKVPREGSEAINAYRNELYEKITALKRLIFLP
jgi:hypothetical protein